MQQEVSNQPSIEGETTDEVIAFAAARGFEVTRRQLAEWHRAGLLPKPDPAYGGRPGSTSIYPHGTGERVVAICELKKTSRSNADLGWGLWWTGFAMPEQFVRKPLEAAALEWKESTSQIQRLLGVERSEADDGSSDGAEPIPTDELLDLLDRMMTARELRKVMTQARKRVGRERFPTVVLVLARVLTGNFTGYHVDPVTRDKEEERALVEKALGLERARTDQLADAPPWLAGDTEDAFIELSRQLRDSPPGAGIETVSMPELDQLRDEFKAISAMLTGWGAASEPMFGRGAFGLRSFLALEEDAQVKDQVMSLLLWRILRGTNLGSAMDMILPLAQQWLTQVQPSIAAIDLLRTEVPSIAAVMDPKRMGRALKSARAQEVVEEIRTVRAGRR